MGMVQLAGRHIWSAVIVILLLTSCEIINPKEDVPSYIHIDKISPGITNTSQGTSSNNICDAWVNIDDNLIGIFELPVTFPVLAKDLHKITVRAGIKNNGIGASRKIYPFFSFYNVDTALTEAKIVTLKPAVTYFPETVFDLMENFELLGICLSKTGDSDTIIQKVSSGSFEGTYSGAIFLDANHTKFEVASSDSLYLPGNNSPVYMELNYKCNQEFIIGLFINNIKNTIKEPVIYLNPSEKWNKIYIDFTDIVTMNPDALHFNVFFRALKSESVARAEIYLDNIKLIHIPRNE